MFKIPEWEDDVPKTQVNFGNKTKAKKVAVSNNNYSVKKISIQNAKANNPVKNDKKRDSRKRKHNITANAKKKKGSAPSDEMEEQIYSTDTPDEVLINFKKKKINESLKNDDIEVTQFTESKLNSNDEQLVKQGNKINRKKELFKRILAKNRSTINVNGNKLRERMMERLKAAQFRYLNEKLYTSSGSEAQELFQSDPMAFETYHQGYQLQIKKWPINPLDIIFKRVMKMPVSQRIADMGCGRAELARRVPHAVTSLDLVPAAGVLACDMARTPLRAASHDAAVYCLALMGTHLTQCLLEANRILKPGGHLLIAEVESRFDNVDNFTNDVQKLGFKLKNLDKSHNVFFFMEFVKIQDPPTKKSKLPMLTLKPCLYKRR